MAREIREYNVYGDTEDLINSINDYLVSSEQYESKMIGNEQGLIKSYRWTSICFRILYANNILHLETWITFTVLPGMYSGESDPNGYLGSAVRGAWQEQIMQIEYIISQFGGMRINPTGMFAPQNMYMTPPVDYGVNIIPEMKSDNSGFQYGYCPSCGKTLTKPGTSLCINCGLPVKDSDGQ